MLIGAAARTASGELSVYQDGGQAADAVLFRPTCYLVLVHVVYLNFVVGTGDLPNHFNGLLAGRAPGAVDFDFSFHDDLSFALK